jgi:hypothetical protein
VVGELGLPVMRSGVVGCVHDASAAVREETIATGGVAEEFGGGRGRCRCQAAGRARIRWNAELSSPARGQQRCRRRYSRRRLRARRAATWKRQ